MLKAGRNINAKWIIQFMVILFLFGSSSSVFGQPVSDPKLNVYYVDVGEGDAIFLDIPPRDCMLIDAGSWDSEGVDRLVAFLQDFFAEHTLYENTIDLVVASHQHVDHIRGMNKVLSAVKVKRYIDNGDGWLRGRSYDEIASIDNADISKIRRKLRDMNAEHLALTERDIERRGTNGVFTNAKLDPFQAIDVSMLGSSTYPPQKNENNNSVVLRVECDDVSFLFSGDAEEEQEERMIERLKHHDNIGKLDVDVYKAGHHGSNTSSTEEFLKAITPKITIVQVGDPETSSKTRGYRLPKESTITRILSFTTNELEETWTAGVYPDEKKKNVKNEKLKDIQSNKEVYFTSSDGMVLIITDGKNVDSQTF